MADGVVDPDSEPAKAAPAALTELERELIAQRTADALGELRSRGLVYGPVPFGWRREGDRLVHDDREQRILTRIRRARGRGLSYEKVARSLNAADIPAKRGGRWYAMAVRSTLLTAAKMSEA